MLNKLSEKDFDLVFELMEGSFPKDEYRTFEKQKALFKDERYGIYALWDEEGRRAIRGFLAVWKFEGFSFIEHFAVNPAYRSQGLGSVMLKELAETLSGRICLEVELPDTDLAARRIRFYERNGFVLNGYPYVQPAMCEGRKEIPLRIMTTGNAVSEEEFEGIRQTLYREVYGTGI